MATQVIHFNVKEFGIWRLACPAKRGTRGTARAVLGTVKPAEVTCERCKAWMAKQPK